MGRLDTATGYEALEKTVYADRLFAFDFAPQLGGNSVAGILSVVAVNQDKISGSSDLTVGSPAISGSEVQAQLSDGTDGEDYVLEGRCTDSSGNKLSMFGTLQVRN